ncbi:MAG: 5-(carboxyamino)imidazole ribonucleotide synthase [Candidatus Nitrosocaldus sp.]|nr:5-(carboxyamino)imidazole ribonucleotide synthase [Candidatus Nitrosocaldus sp.]MDW8275945.1 5-(carboxyamino)imidazole ribonucleotide synthase [Candidatus Nitrosocaldus sp.]
MMYSMNPVRIGIVGGGQLGKMLAMEAKRMSMRVNILDPSEDCPASMLADEVIVSGFNDAEAVTRLAEMSDVVTYEIELADADLLERLERKGHRIRPPASALRIVQDKFMQKHVLRKNGIPVADFFPIKGMDDLHSIAGDIGYPLMLKAKKGGYDGRGNMLVKGDASMDRVKGFVGARGGWDAVYVERFVPFIKEVSVIVARSSKGEVVAYPVAENVHDNGILDTSIVPARIPEPLAERAREIAMDVIEALGGIGVFGVEMFVAKGSMGGRRDSGEGAGAYVHGYADEGEGDGYILVNEVAPRVHNTGHYSIEACNVSQFEQHIRAILDLPLVEPRMVCRAAAMVNILGNESIDGYYAIDGIERVMGMGARVHIYGKRSNRGRRKLGHVTILGDDIDSVIRAAMQIKSTIRLVSV